MNEPKYTQEDLDRAVADDRFFRMCRQVDILHSSMRRSNCCLSKINIDSDNDNYVSCSECGKGCHVVLKWKDVINVIESRGDDYKESEANDSPHGGGKEETY